MAATHHNVSQSRHQFHQNVYILDPRVSSENLDLNLNFSSNNPLALLPYSSLPSYSFYAPQSSIYHLLFFPISSSNPAKRHQKNFAHIIPAKHTKQKIITKHVLIVSHRLVLGVTAWHPLGLVLRVNGVRAGSSAKQISDPTRRWDITTHCYHVETRH